MRARQAVLATNAFPPLLRRLRLMTVPVYDHVLMTEPLSAEQLASIGWAGREGLADAGNLFHYSRLTRDDRVLWGGYDAVYHWGSRIDRGARAGPHARAARRAARRVLPRPGRRPLQPPLGRRHRHLHPVLGVLRHRAGDRVAYAVGYTGLGVAASRFGADVALDLLGGQETERTALRMVREKPLPFPPEPLRWAGITATRHSLAAADRHGGRRNPWLRALDRAGLGFDS